MERIACIIGLVALLLGPLPASAANGLLSENSRQDKIGFKAGSGCEVARGNAGTQRVCGDCCCEHAADLVVAPKIVTGIGDIGCFVAGTPLWITVPQAVAIDLNAKEDATYLTAPISTPYSTIPIEKAVLGQRVPSKHPGTNDEQKQEYSDCSGWKVIRMQVQNQKGSIVDVELLRSEDWIEQNGLSVGVKVDLQMTELKVDATGIVASITEGPEIQAGEGAVIIGRFVTWEGTDLVRVTFEGGTELVGTSNHPIWSPIEGRWRGLGDYEPGEFVQSRAGLLSVTSIEKLISRQPIYNIEVQAEHVYEVTELGVLVHNNPLCAELLELRAAKIKGTLPAEKVGRLEELEKLAIKDPAAFTPDVAEITIQYQEGWKLQDFQKKTKALQDLAERGQLRKAPNPVTRDKTITADYKSDLIKRAYDLYGKSDPQKFNALKQKILDMHPDHVHELQLSGLDEATNLSLLDADVNVGIGNQIWQQIKNLPSGTIVRKIIIKGP